MSFDTFSHNTAMGLLDQGQCHDGSVFDEEYFNSIRGFFGSSTGENQCFEVFAPKLALVPASRYYCDVN